MFDFCIFIDIENNKYDVLATNKYLETISKTNNAFTFTKKYLDLFIDETYKKDIHKLVNKNEILNELNETSYIYKDIFSDKDNSWYKIVFIPANRLADRTISKIIIGCQNIDKEKKKN